MKLLNSLKSMTKYLALMMSPNRKKLKLPRLKKIKT